MKKIGHIILILGILAVIFGITQQLMPQKTKDEIEQKLEKVWSLFDDDSTDSEKLDSEMIAQITPRKPVIIDSTFSILLLAGWNPLDIRPLPEEKFILEGISDGWKWQTDCGPIIDITPRENWDKILCGYIRINSNIDNGPIRVYSPKDVVIKIIYKKFT